MQHASRRASSSHRIACRIKDSLPPIVPNTEEQRAPQVRPCLHAALLHATVFCSSCVASFLYVLSIRPFVCASVRAPVRPFTYPSVCSSVCLSNSLPLVSALPLSNCFEAGHLRKELENMTSCKFVTLFCMRGVFVVCAANAHVHSHANMHVHTHVHAHV